MKQIITEIVKGDELKEGMVLKTWFGNKTILKFKEYTGSLDFVKNIIVFTDGSTMSNGNVSYKVITDVDWY